MKTDHMYMDQVVHVVSMVMTHENIHENMLKIVSEYDQEIPQSQTADKPMAPPRGRATQQS